ncbi:MAG TPA: hypothetical protein VHA06_24035 [Candidatus Angelobacter sp.]|nr:hypothetical protein [Candidatus Angelobacter sp.]
MADVVKDVEPEKEIADMPKVCKCGCGQEMPAASKWAYIKGHKPGVETKKKKRLCGCGCGTALVNRHPFIKGHKPDQNKTPRGSAHRARPASPPRKIVAKPEPLAGIATICVTETNLDKFWMSLSLEEKANLFQRQLEGS